MLVVLIACPSDDERPTTTSFVTSNITSVDASTTTDDFPTTGVSDSHTDDSSSSEGSDTTASTGKPDEGCNWDQDCDVPENTCATARCDVGSGLCTYEANDDPCTPEPCRAAACEVEWDGDVFVGSTCVLTDLDSGSCSDGDGCTVQDACSAGVCVGQAVSCETPPPPTCMGVNLVESLAAGTCVDGACQYPTNAQPCQFGCFAAACLQPNAPLITEILYDDEGTDDNVWIELWAPPGSSLVGLVIEAVNGANGNVYDSFALSGTAPADGFVLIIHTTATNPALVAAADFVDGIADLQNGPDSVRLVNNGVVIDALGYGNFGNAVFAGEGNSAPDVAVDHSLARVATFVDTNDNAADFYNDATPTPAALNN